MIRIIHISDIHFDKTENQIEMIDRYIEDLNKLEDKKIDLIFITGDLVNKGGKNFESIDNAFKSFETLFLDRITDSLNIHKNQIIICPGNHDINRDEVLDFEENGIQSVMNKGSESIIQFMERGYSDISYGLKRIKAYKTFEKEYYNGYENSTITNFESNHILNIDGVNIGISSFNTSWRCYDGKEKIVIGQSQLDNSRHAIKNCDIKIAIMHHAVDFLIESEKRTVKEYIEGNYDYLFLGHVHSGDSHLNIGLRGSIFTSIVQSHDESNKNISNIDYAIGYSIIDIDNEERKIIYRNRRYVPSHKIYVDNVDLLGALGYKEYPMIDDEEKKEQTYIKGLIKRIQDVHVEEFNSHLLSFKTDSIAPKNINDIFVLPKIVESINNDGKKEDIIYNIEDIINSENNLIIFGEKESGKTILLDKIAIDLLDKFNIYNKIPVRIDLKNIQTIEKCIRHFLSESISKVKKLIEDNKIVLIIDNLDCSIEGKRSIEELKLFMTKNKNIKVICSCESNMSNGIPREIMGEEFFYGFTRLYIENWKSNEIEELIVSWFDNTEIEVHDVVEIFQNIKISVTPLNISMFLWVMEHQKNYKMINDAKLIECFFEHLLEKIKVDDIYYDTFDYTNKITFLSNLAYKMLSNTYKYKILYEDLIAYVYEYIHNRKFIMNGEEFINYLIGKGILISQRIDNKRFIAFRFECFYRYFLMQYMLISDDFRSYVISKENYLMFSDEIVYYTGIKRNQEGLLKELTNRMKVEFKDQKILLDKGHKKSYDEYFEVRNCLADKVGTVDIDRMKEEKKYRKRNEKTKYVDNQLSSINKNVVVGEVSEKDIHESNIDHLFENLVLVAKVLRNTEETENGNLKNEVYRDVMSSSIIYSIMSKLIMDEYIQELLESEHDEQFKSFLNELELTSKLVPMMNQQLLVKLLSTAKLEMVLQEEMDNIIDNDDVSELEKYIGTFLLFNINKNKGLIYLNKLIKTFKKSYIKDLLLMKVMWLHKQSESEHWDKIYEGMVAEIRGRGKNPIIKSMIKNNSINNMKNQKLLGSAIK